MSRQVATRGMLAIPVTPEMNESLLGYLTRVAERNVLERPAVLLEGIASWPPSQLTTQQQAQLARVLGLWPRQVKALFDRTYRSGLSANLVSHERRRVSPLMLKQTGCDQALWAVKPLSCCCESWRELIDACPHCGQALRWGHPYLTRCQSCEADLTTVETRAVPPELRAPLRAAARLAAGAMPKWHALGSSLHPDLSALSPAEIFELAVVCGRAAAPKGQKGLRSDARGVCYEDLAAGLKLALGYPKSFRAIADSTDNAIEHTFFRMFAASALDREGELKRVMAVISCMAPEKRGVQRLKAVRIHQGRLTTTELAATLGVEKARIPQMVQAGLFGPRSPRGRERSYDWFSADDVGKAQAVLADRMFASTWAKRIGLNPIDVCQLVGSGLVKAAADPITTAIFPAKLQIDTQSRVEFEADVLARVQFSQPCEDWVSIPRAFTIIGGSHKPWGPVIRSAIGGSLPYGLRCFEGARLNFRRLHIHRFLVEDMRRRGVCGMPQVYSASAACLGAHYPEAMTRTEVETYLNCYPAEVSRLAAMGEIDVIALDPLMARSSSVEKFGAKYISMREMAELYAMPPILARFMMLEAGVKRSKNGFWNRADLRGGGVFQALISRQLIVGVWEMPGPPKALQRPGDCPSPREEASSRLVFMRPS